MSAVLLALVLLAGCCLIGLGAHLERRQRGGQRLVANAPRIPTQTTVPGPPPRGKQDQSTGERAGGTRTDE